MGQSPPAAAYEIKVDFLNSLDVVEIDNSLDDTILVMGDKFESFSNPSEGKAVSKKKLGRNPTLG